MAKKRAAVKTSEPALFSTEQYSSGIGDIERSLYDPYWNEIESESVKQVTLDLDRFLEINPSFSLKNEYGEFKVGDRIYSQQLKRSGDIVSIGKSGFSIEWIGWIKSTYSFSQIEELQLSKVEESISCSHTPHSLPELEGLNSELKPQEQNELSAPESSLKTTTKPNESLIIDFQELNNIQTSEIGNQNQENLTSTQSDSPAQVQALQEMDQDLTTQNQVCGSTVLERSQQEDLISLLLKTPQDLSITDCEQFLGDSEWLDIVGTIRKSFRHRNSAHLTKESDYLLLPTPTTYPKGSGKCRPAGTNRLEQKLRPFINKGDKLHPAVSAWMMGFPSGWVEQVLADTGELLSIQPPLIQEQATTSITVATALTSTVEQLHPNKPALQSNGLSILPNLPELLTPTNTDKQTTTHNKPTFKTGEYVLNGRVGQIIEDSPGEYFLVKYSLIDSNDLKCYFWGQDDELIDQIVIASPELIAQFVRENKEASEQEVKTKKAKTASGSLAPFLENKKLKNGTIVTYPRVHGERDKLNYDHWRWGYYYEIKVNGKWQNKSLPVAARIAPLVREMIDKDYPVGEIKNFILQCKNKKGGGKID